jgi:hypothetical protein
MNWIKALPLGIKIITVFHLFSFVIWLIGQTGAVVAYDTVAQWGLQDPRDQVDPVIVEVNRAIGLTDTVIMLPLFIVAAVGLFGMRFYGAVVSWLVFGMTLYWPIIFWCSQGFYAAAEISHVTTSAFQILLTLTIWIAAAWGSWYLFKNRGLLH